MSKAKPLGQTIRRVTLLAAVAALAVAVVSRTAYTAEPKQSGGIFLQLEGIDGESADPKHKGSIEVQSFSLAAQHAAGEGDKPGKANFNDFFVLKPLDAASPHLLVACAEGRTIPRAVLTVRTAVGAPDGQGGGHREYLKYTFTDLQVSRVNQVVGGAAHEEINFRYGSVVVEYTLPDGKVIKRGWDVKAGNPKE